MLTSLCRLRQNTSSSHLTGSRYHTTNPSVSHYFHLICSRCYYYAIVQKQKRMKDLNFVMADWLISFLLVATQLPCGYTDHQDHKPYSTRISSFRRAREQRLANVIRKRTQPPSCHFVSKLPSWASPYTLRPSRDDGRR